MSPTSARRANRTYRFTSIRLESWKSFLAVDQELQSRVFLVGANASGKSSFLDAFRFLRDVAAVGGGFQEAVRRRGGVTSIRCRTARAHAHVQIDVTIGDDEEPDAWRYSLRFTQNDQRIPRIVSERVFCSGEAILERPARADDDDEERLTQTALEQVTANQPFREIRDFLRALRDWRSSDPYEDAFLEQPARGRFSDGTLRLKRVLWALQDGRGPLLLEKPEHALHPDVVRVLPRLFARLQGTRKQGSGRRQVLASTHSPALLQDAGIGLDEVLLLVPERGGTDVRSASSIGHARALLEGGLSLAEVVFPLVRPKDVRHLLCGGE